MALIKRFFARRATAMGFRHSMPDRRYSFFWASQVVSLCLFALAISLQVGAPVNMDVAYYMRISPQFFAGDFWFGDDAPVYTSLYRVMNYVVYFIPAAAAYGLDISDKLAAKGFVFVLAGLGLFAQARFCLSLRARYGEAIWLSVPAFIFFALVWPVEYFAQREHLFFMLIAPFAIRSAEQLEVSSIDRRRSDWLLGLAAGLGAVIKPQFILTWTVIQAYRVYRFRRTGCRYYGVDAASLIAIALCYAGVGAVLLQVGYEKVFIGLYFYQSYFTPTWELILFRKLSILWILAVVIFGMANRFLGRDEARTVLFLSFVACFLQVVLVKYWIDYHWYPAAAFAGLMACMAGISALGDLSSSAKRGLARRHVAMAVAAFVAAFVAMSCYRVVQWAYLSGVKKIRATEIAQIIQREADGRPVLYLGNTYWPFYPALSEAGLKPATRFSSLFFLAGFAAGSTDAAEAKSFSPILGLLLGQRFSEIFANKEKAFDAVAEALAKDVARYKPSVIMVSDEAMPVRDRLLRHPAFAPVFAMYRQYAETGGHKFLRWRAAGE